MTRTAVVWCPDWPVVAAAATARVSVALPIAVVGGNRVLACSATARGHGVARGQPRREAQSRCPELTVFGVDEDRDARCFEPVAAAVETLAPGVEVARPGLVALAARGPTRYFGTEEQVAERIIDVVAGATGVECAVGIADGIFAATLAAHRGLIVPPGEAVDFLAPLGIGALDQPAGPDRSALVGLLHRLGVRTLGSFAALPAGDVASRFGPEGARAHRLAQGLEERPLARREPPADIEVTRRLDPPVERVDAAAFASREPADDLHAMLAARGLACVRLEVSARTTNGEELCRVWRCAEPLTAAGISDRVRWQLDGWLSAREGRPSSGVEQLRLVPVEVVGGQALQRGLWGESGEADERAGRALVRVQGMLGPDAVLTPVAGGGRGPADRVTLVPWGDELVHRHPDGPWPGRLPAPSPTRIPTGPLPATVLDDGGHGVVVNDRAALSAPPSRVALDRRPPRSVVAWAGPWPVDERWWDPEAGGGQAVRVQAVLDGASQLAVLLRHTAGRWEVEGIYE